ncbi:MAG: FAD-dependent oxidoreductase [Candidatus Acidiferrales bacterium]
MPTSKTYDVAVIGAGVFGAWTAHLLQRSGKSVALIDSYGASNSRASSGGESRIIRMGYGPDELYTRWSMRSLELWREFFAASGKPLFNRTGMLWMAFEDEQYPRDCEANFKKLGVKYEKYDRAGLEKRYPQINFGKKITWGLFEPDSGVLLARRAVQAVVHESQKLGTEYKIGAVTTPAGNGRLEAISTSGGEKISAGSYVFACGPWLPKVFPGILGQRIFPTRQEVFFFGVPAGDARFEPPAMPTWICLGDEIYGMPDLENRGVKIAVDRHGPPIDPDTASRVPSPEAEKAARAYLGERFPGLKSAPIVESRVCQYENTSNGDFLVDRHPSFENVWMVGGGSGHGFKHGPAMGAYVAARLAGEGTAEPRFSLATKQTMQKRAVY